MLILFFPPSSLPRRLEWYRIPGYQITLRIVKRPRNLCDSLLTSAPPNCVVARAPAKLNLFLELLGKRPDGFHDIDTVMVPIDCHDTLVVRATEKRETDGRATGKPEIRIRTDWWPSREHWADGLGQASAEELLDIPGDERNLIHRGIVATAELTDCESGFDVSVRKRIPAGAGMGGASSDAAAAIRATAALTGVDVQDVRLWELAARIGSDVPFFLGLEPGSVTADRASEPQAASLGGIQSRNSHGKTLAMRATGRGEVLSRVELNTELRFIVAFPATSLSTARVYGQSVVPRHPASSQLLVDAMEMGDLLKMGGAMMNRLAEPATKISTLVTDLLEEMWNCGLPRCQLTGSGSACFSLLDENSDSHTLAMHLRSALNARKLPAVLMTARSIAVPRSLREIKKPAT